MAENIEDTLKARGRTHGDYGHHAEVTQRLKRVVRNAWVRHPDSHVVHRVEDSIDETLDMILHKIGRIVAGNDREVDHWQDIAGYATLMVKELEKDTLDDS